MNDYGFRIYYEYNGPTREDPHRTKKNQTEIIEALDRVTDELPQFISDKNATVSEARENRDNSSIIIIVHTIESESEVVKAVERCISGLDLFGKLLEKG